MQAALDTRPETVNPQASVEALLKANRLIEAEAECCRLLEADVNNVNLRCQLAQIYMAQGRLDDALAKARVVQQEYPDNVQALLIMAYAATQRKNLAEAGELVDRVLAKNPDSDEAIIFKARLFATRKQPDAAIALIQNAMARMPENVALPAVLAVIYEAEQQWPKAIEIYQRILQKTPENMAMLRKLMPLLMRVDDFAAVLQYAAPALAKFPDDAVLLMHYGAALEKSGKAEEAFAYYEKSIAANPKYFQAHLGMGNWLEARKEYERAIISFKNCIGLNPKFLEGYNRLGVLYQTLGQVDIAMVYFNKALENQSEWNQGRFMGAKGLPSHKMIAYQYGDDAEQTLDWAWYRGKDCNFIASKINLQEADAPQKYILKGWMPPQPFIRKDQLITTFGSCFAASVSAHLEAKGYKVAARNHTWLSSHVIRFSSGMVNSFSILQQFEWAFENKKFKENLWYGAEKEIAEYDEAIRHTTQEIFNTTDIFVITLGLSEVWCNKQTGEVFWRSIPEQHFDEKVHGFRITTVPENTANLEKIYALIRKHRPEATIIFTVSPVKLRATFRPVSCLTANSVSKAILRAAVDEFYRGHEADAKLFYFPSYELVTDYFSDPYEDDNNHVKSEVTAQIMQLFGQNFLAE